MSAPVEYLPELLALTGMDEREWNDFCATPPDGQRALLRCYRAQVWAINPNAWDTFVNLLGVAATIAGDLTGLSAFAKAL